MIVDSHQHFWRLGHGWHAWPTPDMAAIYRDFDPADLEPSLRAAGVGGTVLVQSAPSFEETGYMLEIARSAAMVKGVVGWVDLSAPDSVGKLESLARIPIFKGIRPMLQDIPDTEWMLNGELRPALRAAADLGLSFDALVKPQHFDALLRFIDRYWNLPVVLDHGGKPQIRHGLEAFDAWARGISRIAARDRVHCKLSGLLTEAPPDADAETLRPYVEYLVHAFGPDRLMWGSDWPTVNLAAGYGHWLAVARQLTQGLSAAEQASIFGGNARRFYRL